MADRTVRLTLLLTPGEKTQLLLAAEKAGLKIGPWMRTKALAAANPAS